MAISTTSTMAFGVQTHYDKQLLQVAFPEMTHRTLMQVKKLMSGDGDSVSFTRYRTLAIRTTALAETATGGVSVATLNDLQVLCTVALYGNYAQTTRFVDLTHIDQNVKNRVELLAHNMAETLDYLHMAEVGVHGMRIRADNSTTYQVHGTTTAAGTLTTIVDTTNLQVTDNNFDNGYVTITDGASAAYGETRGCAASTSSSGTIQTAAFTAVPGSGVTYVATQSGGLSAAQSTHKLGGTAFRSARRELRNNKIYGFKGGYSQSLIDADTEFDFFADTAWLATKEYQDKSALESAAMGNWFGSKVRGSTKVWREAVATEGTYAATGAVHVVPFAGRESCGIVDMAGQPKKVYVKTPDQLAQPIPVYSTVGWEVGEVVKMLNGAWLVNVLCAATAY